jgi:hypothetical protein
MPTTPTRASLLATALAAFACVSSADVAARPAAHAGPYNRAYCSQLRTRVTPLQGSSAQLCLWIRRFFSRNPPRSHLQQPPPPPQVEVRRGSTNEAFRAARDPRVRAGLRRRRRQHGEAYRCCPPAPAPVRRGCARPLREKRGGTTNDVVFRGPIFRVPSWAGAYTRSLQGSIRAPSRHIHGLGWVIWGTL